MLLQMYNKTMKTKKRITGKKFKIKQNVLSLYSGQRKQNGLNTQ